MKIFIPKIIKEWMESEKCSILGEKPLPPSTGNWALLLSRYSYLVWGLGIIILLISIASGVITTILAGVGLLGIIVGINVLKSSLETVTKGAKKALLLEYQRELREWENANRLIKREQQRQLRLLLQKKVKTPNTKKAIITDVKPEIVRKLTSSLPEVKAWSDCYLLDDLTHKVELALSSAITNIWIAILFTEDETLIKYLLSCNWIVVYLSPNEVFSPDILLKKLPFLSSEDATTYAKTQKILKI